MTAACRPALQPARPLNAAGCDRPLKTITRGFDPASLKILKERLGELACLQGQLVIDRADYNKLSRFKELFGFELSSGRLATWLEKRLKTLEARESWTSATNDSRGNISIGRDYFTGSTRLEQLYILVHEARHSDPADPGHVDCPADFRFISMGDRRLPAGLPACDAGGDGAYSFQAAFLFELYARGLFPAREAAAAYNSTLSRVLNRQAR